MKQRIFKAIMLSVMAIMLSIPFISPSHADDGRDRSILCMFPNGTKISFENIMGFDKDNSQHFYNTGTWIRYKDSKNKIITVTFSSSVSCMIVSVPRIDDSKVMEPGIVTTKSVTAEDVFKNFGVK